MVENTPQNREADMPDEIWASTNNAYQRPALNGTWVNEQAGANVKYIRADLANKPALDAEVREQLKQIEFDVATGEYEPMQLFTKMRQLIRAASAVQEPEEVTVEEVLAVMNIYGHPESKVNGLAKKYPNGLKLVKEKS